MELHINKLSVANRLPFIIGGNSLFTIKNKANESRFTYKVTVPKDQEPETSEVYFVSVLVGIVNDDRYYKYIGFIPVNIQNNIRKYKFIYGSKSKIGRDAKSVVAFDFVFNKLVVPGIDHPDLEVWHEGKCCRCGRTLTVPESIEDGIGPECKKISSKILKEAA